MLIVGKTNPRECSFNREGDLLFTMAKDKRPTVWWADDGQRFGTYVGHEGAVFQVRYESRRLKKTGCPAPSPGHRLLRPVCRCGSNRAGFVSPGAFRPEST